MNATPCQMSPDPDAWTSDDPAARRMAARLCLDCPVRLACVLEGTRQGAKHFVWGGFNFADHRQRRVAERVLERKAVAS